MGDEDENHVEDMREYEKSGVRLAGWGLEDLISVLLHAGSGLVPAASGMVNWVAHIVPSLSYSSSTLPSPKNTKLSHLSQYLHAMIRSQPGLRSVGWGWEDMILPGREDPRNCVYPRNRGKSEWGQRMGKTACVFRINRQSEKKQRHGNWRAIWNATRGIPAGHAQIRDWDVSDCSDGVCPLWRCHSARSEFFFANAAALLN